MASRGDEETAKWVAMSATFPSLPCYVGFERRRPSGYLNASGDIWTAGESALIGAKTLTRHGTENGGYKRKISMRICWNLVRKTVRDSAKSIGIEQIK